MPLPDRVPSASPRDGTKSIIDSPPSQQQRAEVSAFPDRGKVFFLSGEEAKKMGRCFEFAKSLSSLCSHSLARESRHPPTPQLPWEQGAQNASTTDFIAIFDSEMFLFAILSTNIGRYIQDEVLYNHRSFDSGREGEIRRILRISSFSPRRSNSPGTKVHGGKSKLALKNLPKPILILLGVEAFISFVSYRPNSS